MTQETLIGLLLGIGFAAAVWLIVLGARRRPEDTTERRWPFPLRTGGRRLAVAVVAATAAGVFTGWPVAGLLALAGVLGLPQLLGRDKQAAARTERMEAIAVWAEMLRDTLSAAAGLEQAILATAPVAPPALSEPIAALVLRIKQGRSLGDALRTLAAEVDDPVADMTVAALVMAAERQARQLAPLLGTLAAATREQVTMRLRIEAGRSRVRTSVRVITLTTVGMAVGLVVLNHPYLEPYGTAVGQLFLATVGALFALAFWWLVKIAALEEEPRVLKAGLVTGEVTGR